MTVKIAHEGNQATWPEHTIHTYTIFLSTENNTRIHFYLITEQPGIHSGETPLFRPALSRASSLRTRKTSIAQPLN